MQLIVVLLFLVILFLAGLSGFLVFYYLRINKAINLFLDKGKIRDAKDILFFQDKKLKEIEGFINEAFDKIKSLEEFSKISFQKIGVVRFNPFNNMGGNQSFAIALLNKNNDGFVISSLFTEEGNRVYAKSVVNGTSEYILSAEEKEAILRAIKNNG